MSDTNPRPRWVPAAELARWVRQALRQAFPRVTFSVRSRTYSMGSSVDVGWTDGPTTGQVNRLVKPFERKTFVGVDDSTGNAGPFLSPTGEIVQASSWVSTQRELTPAVEARLRAFVHATWHPRDAERAYWPTATCASIAPDGQTFAIVRMRHP